MVPGRDATGLRTLTPVSFLVEVLVDALSWALIPRSTWGFILRAAAVLGVLIAIAELT